MSVMLLALDNRSIIRMKRVNRLCWYHWILALSSAQSITPNTLTVFKLALTSLDRPLLGFNLVLQGESIRSHSWFQVSHHSMLYWCTTAIRPGAILYIAYCIHCQLFWPLTVAVRWWYSAVHRNFQRHFCCSSCPTRALSHSPPYLVLLQWSGT